jgi:hypothetical protein
MNSRLLINRKYDTAELGLKNSWYSARDIFNKFSSVKNCDFWDTMSSAGDWQGYIVQKFGNKSYLIPFNQENNWPHAGYKVYTGNLVASWEGYDMSDEEIGKILYDILYD